MYIYPENVHKQIDSGLSNAFVAFIGLLLFLNDQNEIQDFCGLNWTWSGTWYHSGV